MVSSRRPFLVKNSVSLSSISFKDDRKGLRLETIYLSDNELTHFMDNIQINYLLMVKVFNKRIPIDEKIKKIIREMSFTRFNETYLKLLNELEEVKFLKNEELLIDQVSKIIEKIVNDGFLLPLYQNRYSLYVKKKVKGIEVDYYGRPLFQRMRMEAERGAQEKRIKQSAEQNESEVIRSPRSGE